ncbi:hypothetical protein ACWFR1_32425, partial [Streptomyces sp. NPDC055103]
MIGLLVDRYPAWRAKVVDRSMQSGFNLVFPPLLGVFPRAFEGLLIRNSWGSLVEDVADVLAAEVSAHDVGLALS